jgi:hypothetical protein
VLQPTVADRGGAHHQARVRYRGGYAIKLHRLLQKRRGADCRPRFPKSYIIGLHRREAPETEVCHRARGGADIEGIARRHHDHAQVIFPVRDDSIVT